MKNVKISIEKFLKITYAVIEKNTPLFFSIASNYANCKDDENEIVQEAITNTLRFINKNGYNTIDEAKIKAYIAIATRNEGIKQAKERKKKKYGSDLIESQISHFEEKSEGMLPKMLHYDQVTDYLIDHAKTIEKIKWALGEKKFRMLFLWGVEEMNYEEISIELNMNESTVATDINRIRRKLKEMRDRGEL